MRTITYTRRAARGLRRLPANMQKRMLEKIHQYAEHPEALENNVSALQGIEAKRLRVGDWRVIFSETEAEVTVLDIGPRGSVYER